MNNREYDGMSPLPESDIVTDTDTAEEAAETFIDGGVMNDDAPATEEPTAPVVKIPRRRWSFSDDYMTATVVSKPKGTGSVSFDLSLLSPVAFAHIAALGVSIVCGRADDMAAEFARMVSGEASKPRAKAAPKVVNFWRQAIAAAYVEGTKKAAAGQMTLETATAKANGLEKSVVSRLKTDPAVIKQWNKLTGGTIGYSIAASLAEEVQQAA